MKIKLFLVSVLLVAVGMGTLCAQDCEQLLLPFFGNNLQTLQNYPQEKLAYRCAEAYFSFYVTDELDENAPVHDISEVVNRFTGEHLSEDFSVDLEVLSYYGYDFHRFRGLHPQASVYFRTQGSDHAYLVLRSFNEVESLMADWKKEHYR